MEVSFEFIVLRFLGDFVLSADAAEDSCGARLEFDILLEPSKRGGGREGGREGGQLGQNND